jgi:hypothetical protein
MTNNDPLIAEDEPHRRLANRYHQLAADLAAGWDIEAGLADALLPTRHAALVERLRTAFDLEAGLAAILPTSDHVTLVTPLREPPTSASRPSTVSAVAQALNALPAAVRLALRSHPAIVAVALYLQVHAARLTIEIITRDLDLDLARARNLNRDLDLARALAFDLARDLDLDLARDLDLTLDLDLARARARDLDLARADFTGADLRAVESDEGLSLVGVRWSRETKWPPGWAERVERDSVPVGDGVFEIRGGTAQVDSAAAMADL